MFFVFFAWCSRKKTRLLKKKAGTPPQKKTAKNNAKKNGRLGHPWGSSGASPGPPRDLLGIPWAPQELLGGSKVAPGGFPRSPRCAPGHPLCFFLVVFFDAGKYRKTTDALGHPWGSFEAFLESFWGIFGVPEGFKSFQRGPGVALGRLPSTMM